MRICRPRLIDKNRYSIRGSDVIADHRAARFHRIFLSRPLSLSSENCTYCGVDASVRMELHMYSK